MECAKGGRKFFFSFMEKKRKFRSRNKEPKVFYKLDTKFHFSLGNNSIRIKESQFFKNLNDLENLN